MGQQNVLELLEKESMLSSREIAIKLKISRGSVMTVIPKLISQGEVGKVDIPIKNRKVLFKYFKR